MYYVKLISLASLFILLMAFTPLTGELVSIASGTLDTFSAIPQERLFFSGSVWIIAALIALIAFRNSMFAEHASD